MPSPQELLDAARLFLARHAEQLESDDLARAHAACAGLIRDLGATLPQAVRETRVGLAEPPVLDAALLAQPVDAARREALAHASLRKRLAECEGALMHLQVTLARAGPHAPLETARRLVAEQRTARRCVEALGGAVDAWALAVEDARAGLMRPHPRAAGTREALRAARECLLANAPEAACALVARAALDAGVDVSRALEAGARDAVVAWCALDVVERAVNAVPIAASR